MKKSVLLVLFALLAQAAFAQNSIQGRLTASGSTCATSGACVEFAVPANMNAAVLQVSGTFVGTIQFEALPAQPPNGVNVSVASIAGVPSAGGTQVTSTTAVGTWQFGTGGLQTLIARMSAYTSGSAVITMGATNGSLPDGGGSSGGGAVTIANGADVALGATTDPANSATDATPATLIGISKELSVVGQLTAAGIGTTTVDRCAVNDVTPATVICLLKQFEYLLVTAVGPSTAANSNPFIQSFNTLTSGVVTSAMTGTATTQVIGGVASNYQYIHWCVVSNGSTTVSTDILLQDGSGGTTIAVLPAPAASVATTGGGGSMISFARPLKVPTSGNGLFAANVTTGSSTKITCGGERSTISY